LATGDVAPALVRRLLALDDEVLAQFEGASAGTGLVVLAGPPHLLPWVNGVVYLGTDARAPGLRLPTALEPIGVPVELLERSLRRAHGEAMSSGPLGLAPVGETDLRVLPMGCCLPLSRARLRAIAA
jgi:hypothetical protein